MSVYNAGATTYAAPVFNNGISGSSGVLTIDSFATVMGLDRFDGEIEPAQRRLTGGQRLCLQLIESAVYDSFGMSILVGTEWYHKEHYLRKHIRDAKRWLRGEGGQLTVQECFDAINMDYPSALKKLEAAWRKHPEPASSNSDKPVIKKSRTMAGGGRMKMQVHREHNNATANGGE